MIFLRKDTVQYNGFDELDNVSTAVNFYIKYGSISQVIKKLNLLLATSAISKTLSRVAKANKLN